MVKYKKELTTRVKAEIAVSAAKLLSPGRRRLQKGALDYLSGKYNATRRTIQRVLTDFQIRDPDADVSLDISQKRKNCGRKSGLTNEIREIIETITQKYADDYLLLTEALLKEELATWGIFRSASVVHSYLKKMGSEIKTMHVKRNIDQKLRIVPGTIVPQHTRELQEAAAAHEGG